MRGEHGFDLAQLDAEPSHLHLAVEPAEEHDLPVVRHFARSPVRYIRAPPTPANGSGTKRSAVLLRSIEIAAREAVAADEQLAHHPSRHRLQPRVEHVEAGLRDRRSRSEPSSRPRRPARCRTRTRTSCTRSVRSTFRSRPGLPACSTRRAAAGSTASPPTSNCVNPAKARGASCDITSNSDVVVKAVVMPRSCELAGKGVRLEHDIAAQSRPGGRRSAGRPRSRTSPRRTRCLIPAPSGPMA